MCVALSLHYFCTDKQAALFKVTTTDFYYTYDNITWSMLDDTRLFRGMFIHTISCYIYWVSLAYVVDIILQYHGRQRL